MDQRRFAIPDRWQTLLGLSSSDPALKNFRYVLATVNDDAVRTWGELWKSLEPGITRAGMVLPELEQGFRPPEGWPEFLEKFWLLKHYLEVIDQLCKRPCDVPGRSDDGT